MYLTRSIHKSVLLLACVCLVSAQTPTPSQPSTIQNCQTETLDSTGKFKICTACNVGHYISPDKLSCPQCVAGCASCTQSDNCTSCNNGFYLSAFACKACITGCASCSSGTTCSQCSGGYYSSSSTCRKCDVQNCQRCTSSTSCSECFSGYSVVTSTSKSGTTSRTTYSCQTPGSIALGIILIFGGFCVLVCGCIILSKLCNKWKYENAQYGDNQGNHELVIDHGRPSFSYEYGQQAPGQYPAQYPTYAPSYGAFPPQNPQEFPQQPPQPFPPQHPQGFPQAQPNPFLQSPAPHQGF